MRRLTSANAPAPRSRGSRRSARRLAAAASALALGLVLAPGATPPSPAYPGSHVNLEGAGWGHGRGMGQWGALGYAVDHGWNYQQILGHFYGGTTVGHVGNRAIRVRLMAFDGRDTIAFSPGGLTASGLGGVHSAIRVRDGGSGVFHVDTGPGCAGGWTYSGVSTTGAVRIKPASPGEAYFVQACEPSVQRAYRGDLLATRDSDGPQRTVNEVDREGYLRGVVPRESPAGWGDVGGGAGMHALRAQAVAARSYAESQNRFTYAHTCDTTACQVYKGYWDSQFGVREDPRTNQAIADTTNEVRLRNGAAVRTEFSSSTGGHTAGGDFPAVVDDGDDIGTNPNHRWSAQVPVASVEGAYPEIGSLRTVEVTKRNGLGVWGGRVQEVVLRGTNGDRTLSGGDFRSRFGLKSDWFRVVNSPSGGVRGYWVLDTVGGVFTFGEAPYLGSVPELRAQGVPIGPARVVDISSTPSGNGYWVLDEAGGIFSFGDAPFFGSVPGLRNAGVAIGPARVIALAPTPSGNGYWILDDQGGMFSFGDAQFFGSVPGLRNEGVPIGHVDVVAMTPTRSGGGYWVMDEIGGVFAFGDAGFFGSIPALRNAGVAIGQADVVEMAATTAGYWMVDEKGGIFAFGNAPFHGSLPGAGISATAAGIAPTKTGGGYLIVTVEGADVHPFGDAPDFGGVPDTGVQTFGQGLAARWR